MRRVLAVVALVVASCGAPLGGATSPTATPAPVAVTFMAGFKPQANFPFAAVYLAQERGYFAAQGLELTIQHSAGQSEHVQLLATDRVQFSTGSPPDIIKRVAQSGVPLVGIALLGQKGEQAFAVRADSPIASPKDWEGRLVGYKGSVSADYLAILSAAGVDRAKVREVAVGFDPRVLVDRRVDVYPVFKSNEPDLLAKLGVAVRLFDAAEYGVPMLGLGFMTNRATAEMRPDVVRRFLKAVLRGANDAVADREGALDAVMKYAVGEDRDHQRFMLDAEIREALTDATRANGLGWTTREQWERQQQVLLDVAAIAKPTDVGALFSDRFLKEVYREGTLVWP